MKKLLLVAAATLVSTAQTVNAAPAAGCAVAVLLNNNSTSGNERAPTLKNRFGRSVYLITAAELAAKGFPSGKSPTTIGWNYQTGNGLSGSGPLVVYLENTLDTANNKSTNWATAITGMTIVHNATTTLPSAAGPFDITLSGGAPFTYTGGGLYVAFDMQYPVGTLATATAIWCNAGLANGLIGVQGATAPTALTASSYRPETRLTRFIENDAEVTAVYALGELPRGLVSGQTIQAVISNKGANTLNNLVVTLHVTGVDAFTDTQIIPTLSPCGGQATVTFTAFTSCGLGSDTLVVSVPDDDFAAKNSLSQPLNLTPLNYSYKLPGTTASGGVGYNGNSGALVGKFATTAANAVTDVKLEFSTTSATTYRVAIYGDSGSGTPSTTALYVDAADRTVTVAGPVTLTLPSPVAVGPGNFYVGIQQTATVNANLSYDSESPLRSGAFFEASPNPPTAWSDLAPGSNFKLNIGVILQTAMALSVDTDTTNQTVLTGAAVTWSVAASGTGPLAYQWQRDGTNLVEGAGHFTGVTSATLTNSAVSAADGVAVANGYQCLVSLGGCSTTSTKVSLTVKPAARTPVQNGPWSDPATWGGTLPGAGEDVVIPAGFSVTLDVGTPALKNLTIAGTLSLGTNTLQISGNFTNNGAFNPGTGTVEFTGGSDTVMTATFPGTLTFYNLKLNKDASTNTVTALSKLKATKKLTLTKGKLISASDYGDVLIETDGTLELTSDITIGGDLVIQGDGTLTPAGHKITFDGGIAQNLTLASLTTFDDVTVTTGTTLVETESGDAVMVNGTLLNQGVIRKTQAVTGVESYYFGLAGNSGAGLEIDVTDLSGADPLTAIQVDRVDGNPTNAPGTNTTGIYWVITPTGSNFTASLILPHADWPAPQVCRSTGTSWSAARSGFTADTVTRDGLTSFGELAVFNGGVAVAVSDTLGAIKNRAVTVAASVLTANDTVAAGYTLSLTGVDYTGGHGGAVGLAGGVVTYTPAADYTGSDAFTYTVSDGQGGTAVGTVAVTVSASGTGKAPSPGGIVVVGGTVTLTFRGVPNRTYQVQWSDSVNSGDWHDLGITTAGRTGSMTYEDTPPGGTGSRFYRIVYPVHDN